MTNRPAKESSIRLCLGCGYCEFSARRTETGCSTCGPMTADDTQFKCRKGHFDRFLYTYAGSQQLFDLEQALLNANTCHDFKERKP